MPADPSQVVLAVSKKCNAAALAVEHVERKAVWAHVAVTRHAHARALRTHYRAARAHDITVALVHPRRWHRRAKWGYWSGTRKHEHTRFGGRGALLLCLIVGCALARISVCCRVKRARTGRK